jgi:hypothetical protein
MAVDPALTPTTIPDGLTVAVCEFAVDQSALDVIVCLVPSGSVAVAVIWTESVRPTAHGEGDTAIAEMLAEDVELPHPKAKVMKVSAKSGFNCMRAALQVRARRDSSEKCLALARGRHAMSPHSAKAPQIERPPHRPGRLQ